MHAQLRVPPVCARAWSSPGPRPARARPRTQICDDLVPSAPHCDQTQHLLIMCLKVSAAVAPQATPARAVERPGDCGYRAPPRTNQSLIVRHTLLWQELRRPLDITRLFEAASARSPNDLDLLNGLFQAHVR
jgi:hypothetical protein